MAPKASGSRYNKYKKAELRDFYEARTHNLSTSYTRKRYIRLLSELDRHLPPFRFLDLHPEIRNAIYELVTVRRDDCQTSMAILRTSKQAYTEASSIMNAENTLRMNVSIWQVVYTGAVDPELTVYSGTIDGDIGMDLTDDVRHSRILTTSDIMARGIGLLSHVRKMEINLDFNSCVNGPRSATPSTIFPLAQNLLGAVVESCSSLRQLKVIANKSDQRRHGIPGDRPTTTWHQVLKTFDILYHLPEKVTLDIEGLPDKVYNDFWMRVKKREMERRLASLKKKNKVLQKQISVLRLEKLEEVNKILQTTLEQAD